MAGFAPLLGSAPRILILGSMPSQASLEVQQYYAHPRNAFWSIMAELFAVPSESDYSQRVSALIDAGVSVWDVLRDCDRSGSLDSAIVKSSEQANDFEYFLSEQPSIKTVGFNGRAARDIFSRHCRSLYDKYTDIRWLDLPSTSPAYAAMSLVEKQRVWQQRLLDLNSLSRC